MAYQPPTGWVEQLPQTESNPFGRKSVFHTQRDCRRVRSSASDLRSVDRPYSAARCPACAANGERVNR